MDPEGQMQPPTDVKTEKLLFVAQICCGFFNQDHSELYYYRSFYDRYYSMEVRNPMWVRRSHIDDQNPLCSPLLYDLRQVTSLSPTCLMLGPKPFHVLFVSNLPSAPHGGDTVELNKMLKS